VNNRRVLQELYSFWTEVFQDQTFVESWASMATVQMAQLQDRMASVGEVVGVDTIQPLRTQTAGLLQLTEELQVRTIYESATTSQSTVRSSSVRSITYSDGYRYDSGLVYDAAVATPYWEYALPEGVVPRYLTTSLFAPAQILSSPEDFEVIDGRIRLYTDPSSLEGIQMQSEGEGPGTKMRFLLWSCAGLEDAQAIQKQFGRIAQLTGTSSARFKEALQVIWDLRVLGASDTSLARALCVLTDTDYYTGTDEVARAIYLEYGRRCVLTDTAVYTAPMEYEALISVGDAMPFATQLFGNYIINGASSAVITANGLMVPTSLLGANYRGPIYIPNESLTITPWTPDDHTYVRYDTIDGVYQVRRESDSAILFTVPTEATAAPYLNQPAEYYLPLGGFVEDVELFNAYLNAAGFYTWLTTQYSKLPEQLNPLADLRRWLYADRVTIAELPASTEDFRGSVLNALAQTWPAGSMLVFEEIVTAADETCSTSQMAELQELFYVMDAADDAAPPTDHAQMSLTL